jgi:hypothetical protein
MEAFGLRWGFHTHAVIGHDRQAGEITRLSERTDDRLARDIVGCRGGVDQGRFADARIAPQADGDAGATGSTENSNERGCGAGHAWGEAMSRPGRPERRILRGDAAEIDASCIERMSMHLLFEIDLLPAGVVGLIWRIASTSIHGRNDTLLSPRDSCAGASSEHQGVAFFGWEKGP